MLTRQDVEDLAEFRTRLVEADRQVQKHIRRFHGIVTRGNSPHPLIAFVHIPKTAGGTVSSMFVAAYSKYGMHKAGNYLKGPDLAERKIAKADAGWENWHRQGGRVTVGHMPYGLYRTYLPRNTCYMTFLREPVDRVLSHYYRHIHRQNLGRAGIQKKKRPGARAKADSIEQALVDMNLPQLNNLSTRFLCGRDPFEELPDSALDDAKENLRTFEFVGIQERFEESLVLLQRMFGLGGLPYVDRHVSNEGARPRVDEISDEQRALIEERNRLDAELYRFGLGLFEESVAAAGDGFAAEVEELRARDRAAREQEWRRTKVAMDPLA
jgi:hypothetical protein